MKLLKTWTSGSLDTSKEVAHEISEIIRSGDTVLLEGDLGSGKTFFVQHICQSWNVINEITSPTFTIIQNYSGEYNINHFDLYRLEEINELDQLGWEDFIYSDAITFIEWPQMIEPLLISYYKMVISIENGNRIIELFKK